MDAMLKLVTDHNIQPDQIKAIRLRAGSNILEPLRYQTAKTELEAKFCVPFLLGVIALRRKAGIQEFTDEFVSSAPIQQIMTKVSTVFDQKIEAMGFDKIRSIVEVDLVDGRTFTQPSDERYRGSPAWPFTIAELRERFADCASPLVVERSHPAGARPDRVGGEDQGHPRAHPYPDGVMHVMGVGKTRKRDQALVSQSLVPQDSCFRNRTSA